MAEYDRSSKWLIQHYGQALLRLAGVQNVISCRALQAELVQTGQLPDGLLEAEIADAAEPRHFVVEIATYPEQRLIDQLIRDALLVVLNRRAVPEVLAVILHPKGAMQIPGEMALTSPLGWTELRLRWRIVELWKLPAEALLATSDPGVIPWVPLAHSEEPSVEIFRRCREVIDTVPAEDERWNLLAVTQVLARLRYNSPELLRILGGQEVMIESPLLEEWRAQWTAEAKAGDIIRVLQARFGALSGNIESSLRAIQSEDRLNALIEIAAQCPDLESFRSQLPS